MKKYIFLSIMAIVGIFLFPPQNVRAARNDHFLGIGLGWNIYNKSDVTSLGNPWVYNWTVPGSSGNNPHTDFGNNYVPMVFGCSANSSTRVKTWIDNNSYSGPVLFLNEPDNGSANGGSACTPEAAVNSLSQFIQWKKDNNKNIDIIFGGVYFGPDMNWARVYPNNRFWLEEFYYQWKQSFNTNPEIQGFHFHVYPWNPAIKDGPGLVAHLKRRMEGGRDPIYNQNFMGWNTWINQNSWVKGTKNQLWITETGVLDGSISKQATNYVMEEFIPYLDGQSHIQRVAWFTHAINSSWTSYDQTALMNIDNTARTSSWTSFKSLCSDGQYCKTTGGGNPSPTRTPTPSNRVPTRTPTPSRITPTSTPRPGSPTPTKTSTPTPPRNSTPTSTPRPSATRTPTPPRLSPTRTPTPPRITATRTPTPRSSSNTVRLYAVEDAHVRSSSPTSNYGSASKLEVDASSNQPTDIAYIKFDITQIKGLTPRSAQLKVKIANSSADTQIIYFAANANWSQNTITYTNSRALSMTRVATMSNAQSGQIKEINVSGAFSGVSTANTMTFIISSNQSDGMDVYSKEGGVAPILEITY